VKRSKWWTRTALKQDINLNSDLTFYTLHGDYLAIIGTVLALIGMLFILIKTIKISIKPLMIKNK